mgnify:FL=1
MLNPAPFPQNFIGSGAFISPQLFLYFYVFHDPNRPLSWSFKPLEVLASAAVCEFAQLSRRSLHPADVSCTELDMVIHDQWCSSMCYRLDFTRTLLTDANSLPHPPTFAPRQVHV